MNNQVQPTQRQKLSPATLGELDRDHLRPLVHVLLVEAGLDVVGASRRDDLDDLRVESTALLRRRLGRVRVMYRPIGQGDVDELAELVRAEALADAVLVATVPHDEAPALDRAVQVIDADELVARIRASALVAWRDGLPHAQSDRFADLREIAHKARALDPVGMRWLPTLGLNAVPPELEGVGSAEDLLETVAFRLLTVSLRLRGRRLGSQQRGQRVPDALLEWDEGQPLAALLDCKAAQFGYHMGVDDERALREYHAALSGEIGRPVEYIVVLSGEFQGDDKKRHPYHHRAANLRRETNAQLVYVRAIDLSALALALEDREAPPAEREQLPWSRIFDLGLPNGAALRALARK